MAGLMTKAGELGLLGVNIPEKYGGRLYQRGNFAGAAEHYGRAVALYTGCAADVCGREEVALAHQNRVVALFEASSTAEARAALEQAEAQGLRFPELRAMLPAYDFE